MIEGGHFWMSCFTIGGIKTHRKLPREKIPRLMCLFPQVSPNNSEDLLFEY